MTYNWFDDARFRLTKSGSGYMDLKMLVSSEGAWYIYWGNADAYGSVKEATSGVVGAFPDLYTNDAMQTAPSTATYNCASWAGGMTNGWFWECLTADGYSSTCLGYYYGAAGSWGTWDDFFGNNPLRYTGAKDYTRTSAHSGNGEIALWATGGSIVNTKHFSVRREANNNPHGYDWESEPGGLERIFHPRDALNGLDYGAIIAYYRDSNRDPNNPWNARLMADANQQPTKKTYYSLEESVSLGLSVLPEIEFSDQETSKVADLMAKNYSRMANINILFDDWMAACKAPELRANSNTTNFFDLDQCRKIIKLHEIQPEAVMTYLFDKVIEGKEESFEVQFAAMLLVHLTYPEYGQLMEEVKQEWARNNYTKEGAYVVPMPTANTKKRLSKKSLS